MEETESSIFADGRLGKAVGPNAAHHLRQWKIMVSRVGGDPTAAERRFSFNAGAMLLGPVWLLHRKLYVPGLLALIVVCGGLIASPAIGLALAALFARPDSSLSKSICWHISQLRPPDTNNIPTNVVGCQRRVSVNRERRWTATY